MPPGFTYKPLRSNVLPISPATQEVTMYELQVFTMDGSMGDYIWRTTRKFGINKEKAYSFFDNLGEDYRLKVTDNGKVTYVTKY